MNKETLKEVAENKFGLVDPILGKSDYRMGYESGLIAGAKWQQERSYSEEEVINAFNEGQALNVRGKLIQGKEWFEQFKKK
jgi:hypothetical protein